MVPVDHDSGGCRSGGGSRKPRLTGLPPGYYGPGALPNAQAALNQSRDEQEAGSRTEPRGAPSDRHPLLFQAGRMASRSLILAMRAAL